MNSRQRRKLAAIEHNQKRAEMLERRANPQQIKKQTGNKLAILTAFSAMAIE
jgi:hypothetical protein